MAVEVCPHCGNKLALGLGDHLTPWHASVGPGEYVRIKGTMNFGEVRARVECNGRTALRIVSLPSGVDTDYTEELLPVCKLAPVTTADEAYISEVILKLEGRIRYYEEARNYFERMLSRIG